MLLLQEYDFEIIYNSRWQYVMANYLWRIIIEKASTSITNNLLNTNMFMVQNNPTKLYELISFIDWQAQFIDF